MSSSAKAMRYPPHHELGLLARRAELRADGGRRHVRDRRVRLGEERRRQEDREDDGRAVWAAPGAGISR